MGKADITKKKILEAALYEFSEKGIFGARINEIAQRSGMNKRLIYEHFGNKEQLYTTILTIVYERLAKRERQVISQDLPCVEAIEKIIYMYFDFFYKNQSFVKMVMWENLNDAKYIKSSLAVTLKENALDFAKSVLIRGIDKGIFKDTIDVDEVVISINMFTFSYYSNIYTLKHLLHRDFKNRGAMEKRCAHVTALILDHILKK